MILRSSAIKKFPSASIVILLIFMVWGCGTPRRLAHDQALLNNFKIEGIKGKLREDANLYVRQKPNRKLLGIGFLKVYLGIYNTFDGGKNKKWKNRIKNGLGEPPVIYDSTLTVISASQIQQFLFNKGYFNAQVSYSDTIRKKKASVVYSVKTNQPYTIRNINYNIKDTLIRSIYFSKLKDSKIKLGDQYDQDKIQDEREAITNTIKDAGYYYFNREYIHFDVDSALDKNQIDIFLVIENQADGSNHVPYMIDSIMVRVTPKNSRLWRAVSPDTVYIDKIGFINPLRNINNKLLRRMIYIEKDKYYHSTDVDLTYSRFGELGVFKFVSVDFTRNEKDSTKLDCIIDLSMNDRRYTNTEVEGYVAQENFGSSVNFVYTDRNIFKGAEKFEFRIRGGLETQAFIDETQKGIPVFNSREANTSATITFPGFLLFKERAALGRYSNPRTRLGVNYIFEKRPEYIRRTLNSSFVYEWKQSQYVTHSVSPIDVNFVRSELSEEALKLLDGLNNQYIKASFDPHVSLGARYSLIINKQIINLVKDYYYFRFTVEVAGTSLYLVNNYLLSRPKDANGAYQFLNLPFYNYTRPEVDFRYFDYFNRKNLLVYRFNAGAGFAYWNSKVLPFERQFFTGGSNSIRAYKARAIGPGSFNEISNSNLNLDQTGDMKLEGNVEYRFDIFDRFIGSKLKGATFLDFGNVWTITDQNSTPGTQFKLNTFYKELAVGTGLGFRMDYSFLLLRFDFGLKLRDPRFISTNPWVITHFNDSAWKLQNQYGFFNFNFGVGYPF